MRIRRLRQVAGALVFVLGAVLAGVPAPVSAASLEPLLKAADFQTVGLKGVALSPPDAYDRIEQMGFETASDATMVAVLSRIDTSGSGGTLRPALEIIAKDVTPVGGVGDEACSFLGGMAFAFRKGKAAFQLMCGINLANGKPFLTKEQLAALAKVVCSRL